jgi:hypothetical protein
MRLEQILVVFLRSISGRPDPEMEPAMRESRFRLPRLDPRSAIPGRQGEALMRDSRESKAGKQNRNL